MQTHEIWWCWNETKNRLETFHRRVQEGRDVQAAVDFARFIQQCGLIKLFEEHSQPEPLKIDGAFIRWKAEELERCCTERFRTNSSEPTLTAAYLQSLHEKIDLMAGYLSKLTVSPALSVTNGVEHEHEQKNDGRLRDPEFQRLRLAD